MINSVPALQPPWPTLGWMLRELRIYAAVALLCAVVFVAGGIVFTAPISILAALAIFFSATFAIVASITRDGDDKPTSALAAFVRGLASKLSARLETRNDLYVAELREQSARLRSESDRLLKELEAFRIEKESDERQFQQLLEGSIRRSLIRKRTYSIQAVPRTLRRRINRSLHSPSST
ncbi:MAG: hypothetical protein JO107_05910 [Hyphomicrobiales bacterium]|nr:hypothetical protein [Hyphomicrobiales bacterium]MBV8662619.1 hypothetical protein [Hyphomicrobiales bacterium]